MSILTLWPIILALVVGSEDLLLFIAAAEVPEVCHDDGAMNRAYTGYTHKDSYAVGGVTAFVALIAGCCLFGPFAKCAAIFGLVMIVLGCCAIYAPVILTQSIVAACISAWCKECTCSDAEIHHGSEIFLSFALNQTFKHLPGLSCVFFGSLTIFMGVLLCFKQVVLREIEMESNGCGRHIDSISPFFNYIKASPMFATVTRPGDFKTVVASYNPLPMVTLGGSLALSTKPGVDSYSATRGGHSQASTFTRVGAVARNEPTMVTKGGSVAFATQGAEADSFGATRGGSMALSTMANDYEHATKAGRGTTFVTDNQHNTKLCGMDADTIAAGATGKASSQTLDGGRGYRTHLAAGMSRPDRTRRLHGSSGLSSASRGSRCEEK